MAKRISKPIDLPDWFKTEKYSGVLQLGARGWFEQLIVRNLCCDMVRSQIEGDVIYEGELDDGELLELFGCDPTEFLEAVRTNPMLQFRDSKFKQSIEEYDGSDYMYSDQFEYPPGIEGITPMDILSIIREWSPELRDEYWTWVQSRLAKQKDPKNRIRPPSPQRNWVFRPVTISNRKPITVNTFFPPKLLAKSLDRFITQERAYNPTNRSQKDLRSNTFVEWCNCGLLQYLDLKIWSLQEGISITNKALAYGIFPDDYEKGEENIRTTTKKHADMIFRNSNAKGMSMSTLLAHARLEDFIESQA